jgi:hypothetical protein
VSLRRRLARGLHALGHRAAVDREIDEEVAHFLDEATAAHRARGLSPEEARRAARAEVGNPLAVREEVRGYGWENAIETLAADVRYAVRRLRKEPGFTAVAVATLAVGIGAAAAIFSVVRPVLFEPLPYPDAGRIAMIWEMGGGGERIDGTFGMYRELAERAGSFEAIAVLKPWQPALTGADRPERLEGQRVSASWFDVLGVPPLLGRGFQPSEDRLGGPNAVVLSDGLWRRRFGADPAIVGRPIVLDEDPYTIVGVMPAGFENVLAPSAELWAPLQYDMSQGRAWGHHLRTVGRLRPGVGHGRATDELDAIGRAAAGIYGVLAGSVAERTREIGVRSALGASRRAILAMVVRQGIALTGLGVLLGAAGAVAASQAITALLFGVSPLDPATYLGVVAVLAGVAMIACGVPAWRAAQVDPASTLRAD